MAKTMDLAVLSDETLLRYYEDIRAHVSTDIRPGGGHRFVGKAAKERADGTKIAPEPNLNAD